MSRNAFLVRLLAAVGAIAAIALAAATLESPIEAGGDGGFGSGDGEPGLQPPPSEQPGASGVGEIPAFLEYLVYAILIVVAIVTVWYLIANRREAVRLIAVLLVVCLVGAAIVFFLMGAAPDPQPPEPPQQPNDTGGGGGGLEGSGETESFSTGPVLFVLAVITAIFVGGLLVSRGGGSGADETTPVESDEGTDRSDAVAVADAAGRAADRIDDDGGADVDNEIYRAWREMTDRLEVDRPESSTPREFARAAVDAGLEREHVDELTRLFEDVRYGDAETTPEMEARAVEVLRRIEETYAAADDGDGDADADDGPNRGEPR